MRWIAVFLLVAGLAPAVAQSASRNVSQGAFQILTLPRSGFNLAYRSAGDGDPVLILSGGPGMDCDYMAPVALVVAKSAHAILLEQRGTGRSRPSIIDRRSISLASYIEDYEALRAALHAEHWTVIGHSAGGLLAMYYAAAYPARIDRLVLLDSAPVASQFLMAFDDNTLDRLTPDERLRKAQLEAAPSPETANELALIQANAFFFDRKLGSSLGPILGKGWHSDIGRLLGSELTPPTGYDLRPQLKDFDRPVLVMSGRQDPMDPLMAYQTAAAFRHATLKFIDRAGHFPWFEQPEAFAETLDEFIRQK